MHIPRIYFEGDLRLFDAVHLGRRESHHPADLDAVERDLRPGIHDQAGPRRYHCQVGA
jgi:hypothetical protein